MNCVVLVALMSFGIGVVGCSSSGGATGAGGGGGGTGTTADCSSGSGCKLLTAADVNTALGTSYASGSGMAGPIDMAGQITSCFYEGAIGTLSASLQAFCLQRTLGAADYKSFADAETALGYNCSPVSGIGDAAYWCVPTPDGGSTSLGDVVMFFSGSVQAEIDVSLTGGGLPPGDQQGAAENLAKAAVSRF